MRHHIIHITHLDKICRVKTWSQLSEAGENDKEMYANSIRPRWNNFTTDKISIIWTRRTIFVFGFLFMVYLVQQFTLYAMDIDGVWVYTAQPTQCVHVWLSPFITWLFLWLNHTGTNTLTLARAQRIWIVLNILPIKYIHTSSAYAIHFVCILSALNVLKREFFSQHIYANTHSKLGHTLRERERVGRHKEWVQKR